MFKLIPRENVSPVLSLLGPLFSVGLTMIVGGILFYFLGVDPFAAIKMIFWDPLMSETFSTYSIPQIFIKGAPLILIALGLSVGFKANVWNIGAEGQYIMGAIFGASFALSFYPLESIVIFPAMILIGVIGGFLWSMIPAFLKVKFQVNEILVSLMLVYVAEQILALSSLGFFREITSAPFNYNDHLYFLDRSGKIAVFNPITLSLHWEYDIGENIVYYLFSDNGNLFILSNNDVYVISNDGIIINTYNHNKELPILIFNINENLYLVSEDGITSINLNKKSEEKFYKNKFTANLDIYYQDQTIYLKDGKSLFKLSE